MSEREDRGKFQRIVVAFDATPLGEVALEAAAGLAAALDAELSGLFVEDIDLMRMAELPFTRELGLVSAVIRPFGALDVERAFRLQAERTRALLESVASAHDLRWSFEVVRGQALAALKYLSDVDVVVFGKGAHGYIGSVGIMPLAGFLGGEARRRRGRFRRLTLRPIALLFDGSRPAWRTLSVGFALAATAETRLTLLVLAENREEFERLRELAKTWLAERGAAARFVWLRSREVASVVEAVTAEGAAALVWHDETARQDRRGFHALLSALRCPLVLIS